MKSKSNSSRALDHFGLIETLEPRIAPAAATPIVLPANPKFVTATAAGALLIKAGEVLTTGADGGGSYLLYVATGEVLVHTTDLNHDGRLDFNEITGLSVGPGASFVCFTDIHGDIVTDLNPATGQPDDGGKGDILLDANILEIDMRSLNTGDFAGNSLQSPAQEVTAHLAVSNYSIFGNIYAGGGLGAPNDLNSGLAIDSSGAGNQATVFNGDTGDILYKAVQPTIGSIYVGSAASGQYFSFGVSGHASDLFGNLLTFTPTPGEAGASIYNIGAGGGETFSIGTIHAGDGGFNAPGGSIVNVALSGSLSGVYKLISGDGGTGPVGQNGGSIVNFSETGAFISEVVLQAGAGGVGLAGAGGNAGQIGFNPNIPIAVNAHFVLNYGNGGDGYASGGAGGGTANGTFVTPAGTLTNAINVTATMHPIGSIGTNTPFSFTNDGYNDAVFSTSSPNQLVVALGYEGNLLASSYIYLNSPQQVDSITVGDFTGNGHPDIAVACGVGSYAGVEVYLSQYNPHTGAFEGFSDPIYSPLPDLDNYGFDFTSVAITRVMSGDFTGKGVTDLAVVAQEFNYDSKTTDSVLIFMDAETNATHPGGSGLFYANFVGGNHPINDLGQNAHFSVNSNFNVTALKEFAPGHGHDLVVVAGLGAKNFQVYSDFLGSVADVGGGAYGKVDTNRKVGVNQIADTNMTGLALAITQEPARPQYAAIVALSDAPSSFLEVFTQPGGKNAVPNANFQLDTGNNVDQAGIYFGNSVSNPVAIVAVPDITRTVYSDVAILDYAANADNLIYVIDITESLTALTASATVATGQSAMGVTAAGVESGIQRWDLGFPANGRNPNSVAFTMYEPFQGDMDFGFVTGNPISGYPDYQGFFISAPIYLTVVKGVVTNSFGGGSFADTPFKVAGYFFNAGNGGNSESGAGGAGGSLGATLTINGTGSTATGTGSLSVEFPTNQDYEGNVYFNAGNGGNGFNNAGNGGNIIGVSVTYPTPVQTGAALLTAGTGGQSLTGTGGAGGSLSQLFIQSGEYFQAGDGGVGVVGGSGGSLLGNTQPGLITANTSNVDPYITLVGGNGATGILGGGNGGGINSFVNQFDALVFGTGGSLSYTAGNAGNAVAGHGGAGGSIINSSPDSTDNNLVGDIYLYGGQGGSGLYGGAGGSITNFAEVSTINESPTAFAVFAGFGGNATIGSGGAGGNITGISIAASGTGGGGVLGALHYNRLVAGAGGASAGGTGGSGGSIGGYGSGEAVNTTSVAAGTQNVDAAGAGGAGLSAGGNGGNVINVQADAAASAANSTGKVVIIAGDGGESTGALPAKGANATETARNIANAVGGVNGPGGNGGSIINFTQATSIYTNVDLIAGNGGATINHSVAAGNAAVDNSGEGGSVGNIAVQGSIGDCAAGIAIRSYNNFFAGQTMQEFVDSYIIGDISGVMDDAVGNVGLVAGAAGRVEGGLPSTDGINGSVNNIIATNIMSMVAGNVDQVDFIQNLTNYKTYGSGGFGSGILGANKTASSLPGFTGILGGLNYINAAGTLVNTPIPGGGALLDGAFMAKNERQPSGVRDFIGTTG